MSIYSLDRLEPGTFENIIQSLCQGMFGIKLKIYGSGTDGQREAVFEDKNNFLILGTQLSGRSIFQAKYKNAMTKKDDYTWLREQLKKELDGFAEKNKTEPDFIPDNYLFFTNVVLTPQKDLGIKDKIEEFIKKYEYLIPNIYVIGYDEICTMLDNNREVATSYASFIYSGDVLTKLYNYISFKENTSIETLMRFMEKEFEDDSLSRMEQAGMLTENKLSLQRVFVDLQVNADMVVNSKESLHKFVQQIIMCGNSINRNKENNNEVDDNKYVLMGNAGQGKSTLCQFTAQIYRAFFLINSSTCPISKNINNFIKEFKNNYNYAVDCFRIPVRIVLKDYANWISKIQLSNQNYSIINYILNRISVKDGSYIPINDFRILLNKYSWIFIFDGLDEVPSSSNREEVLREISNFIDIDLRRQQCDNIIIATSRPQGYGESFDANHYRHLQLAEMDNDMCMTYLKKLMKNMEPNGEKRKEYIHTLEEAIENNMISRLMRTPLQATIIAILVKSGGKPPKNRYNLFNEYYHTIVNREKQKGIIETLNDDLGWIDDIHYKIGLMLQMESERSENPSAILEKNKFMTIIKEYISEKEDEDEVNINAIENKAKLLFEIIVLRLTFISEFQEKIYGFSIRSIQEFFAANYITRNQQESNILRTIKNISLSAYWRNVLMFTLAYINKERLYLEGNIDSLCSELNGSDLEYGESTANSISHAGSWLALDILVEGIFKSNPKIENKYLSKVAELFELEATEKFISITLLSSKLIKKFLDNHIVPYLRRDLNNRSVWYILGLLYKSNNMDALTIIREFWPNNDFDVVVINMYIEKLKLLEGVDKKNNEWLFEKICNCKYIDNIYLSLVQCEILASYVLKNQTPPKIIAYLLKNALLDFGNERIERNTSYKNLNELFNIDITLLGKSLGLFRNNNRIYFEIVDGCKMNFYNISDVSENIELLENSKYILEKYEVDYYYQYTNFYMKPNYKSLVNLLKSYIGENNETQRLIRKQLIRTNWLLRYINENYLDKNKISDLIDLYDNKAEDDKWMHIDKILCNIVQNEKIDDFNNNENVKYISVSCTNRSNILKSLTDKLHINFEDIGKYSKAFISKLIFITSVSIAASEYDLCNSEILEYDKIRKLYDFYSKTTFEEEWVKKWGRIITLFILLNSNNNELLRFSNNNDFKEFELQFDYDMIEDNLNNKIVEKILNSILNIVLFTKQETNILKIIPQILTYKSIDYSKINIKVDELNNINCINNYNRFGKLIICSLYSKNNDIIDELKELAKEFDNLYLYEQLLLIYDKIPIKSDFQEAVLSSLYDQLKSISDYTEKGIKLLAKYENELLYISSSKISNIDI